MIWEYKRRIRIFFKRLFCRYTYKDKQVWRCTKQYALIRFAECDGCCPKVEESDTECCAE